MDVLLSFLLLGAVATAFVLVFMLFRALKPSNTAYQFAVGLALGAALLLVWLNGAVGIIGTDDNEANVMYVGVLIIGMIGAISARFEPLGMARALYATALAQALVAIIAVVGGLGSTVPNWPWDTLGVTGIFVALWLGSALLFRNAAAGERSSADADLMG